MNQSVYSKWSCSCRSAFLETELCASGKAEHQPLLEPAGERSSCLPTPNLNIVIFVSSKLQVHHCTALATPTLFWSQEGELHCRFVKKSKGNAGNS